MRQVHYLLKPSSAPRPVYDQANVEMLKLVKKGPGALPPPTPVQMPVAAGPAASGNVQRRAVERPR